MNLHLQNKIICITDNGDLLVSIIAWVLEREGAIPCRVFLDHPKQRIKETVERYGQIDGLVNTLAPDKPVSLEHGGYDAFVGCLKDNVVSTYLVTQAAIPYLQRREGAIVNLISCVAETGQGNASGYAAACGGRIGLTTAWAEELAPLGIRVNGIMLSYENAPFENRETTSQEIADAVTYLLSYVAMGVQGELFYVDGGYVHLAREIGGTT